MGAPHPLPAVGSERPGVTGHADERAFAALPPKVTPLLRHYAGSRVGGREVEARFAAEPVGASPNCQPEPAHRGVKPAEWNEHARVLPRGVGPVHHGRRKREVRLMAGTSLGSQPARHRFSIFPLLVGVPIGLLLSSYALVPFGLLFPWMIAIVCIAGGLIVKPLRGVLFSLGLGIMVGALLYLALGLFNQLFEAPSSGSGSTSG